MTLRDRLAASATVSTGSRLLAERLATKKAAA